MAFTRKNRSVVETNHVSAVRTGNIKAQYPAKADMENGMAIAVDDVAKEMTLPKTLGTANYLHASEEHLYEGHPGRNAFYIKNGEYARALKLEVGDIFETNALATTGTYAAGNVLTPGTDGFWVTGTGATEATIVEMVGLPNGEAGAKLVITKVGA